MSDTGKIAGIVGGASAVALIGYILTRPSAPSVPPRCEPYDIAITGSSVVDTGVDETYTVTVDYNNAPLTSTAVTLSEVNTTFTSTALTNSQGVASFTVNFKSAGTYYLVATVNGCSSAGFSVTTRTPCADGQIRINGVCTDVNLDLVASATNFIGIPATVTFTATLRTASGSPIQGYPVTLEDETTGSNSTNDTDSNGEATFSVTLNKAGEYQFEAIA